MTTGSGMAVSYGYDHPAILALYERCGYRGGLSDADEILVATIASELIGVIRLCSEEGTTVLRGMQVHPDWQRRGIGSTLLHACAARLGPRICFCLPYDHLVRFYGHAGFRPLDAEDLPSFLHKRMARYRLEGSNVIAMVRTT